MKYRIENGPESLDVSVVAEGADREQIKRAFQACCSGDCVCPTREQAKLAGLEVEECGDGLVLHLRAKVGTEFNARTIEGCLRHTMRRSEP